MITYLLVFALGGYLGYDLRDDQAMELAAVEARSTQSAQAAAAAEIAKITITETTITQPVLERIRVEKVYSDCKHSPEMMLDINEALTGVRK